MVKNRARDQKEAKFKEAAQQKKVDRATKKQLHKDNSRRRGRQSQGEDAQFEAALGDIGCRVHAMTGDGNCMFRAIADQVEGDHGKSHARFRSGVMQHIEDHRGDFEPFMEDDEKFEAYLARMRKDGEWGGHQELFAASQMLEGRTFVVHQWNAPRFEIRSSGSGGSGGSGEAAAALHLSYHGEEHYNSVRALDDPALPNTPPRPIRLNLAAERSGAAAGQQQPPHEQGPEGGVSGGEGDGCLNAAERLVALSLPSAISAAQVRATLADVDGDAPSAIELLVAGYVSPTTADDSGEGDIADVATSTAAVSGKQLVDKEIRSVSGTLDSGGEEKEEETYLAGLIEAIAAVEKADAAAVAGAEKNEKSIFTGGGEGGSRRKVKNSSSSSSVGYPTRSDLCPCGSQKKYKKCCMKADKRNNQQQPVKLPATADNSKLLTSEFGAILI